MGERRWNSKVARFARRKNSHRGITPFGIPLVHLMELMEYQSGCNQTCNHRSCETVTRTYNVCCCRWGNHAHCGVEYLDYQHTFFHTPFTCMYRHLVVPSGGKLTEGSGFNCMDGNGCRGAISTEGRSRVLSHTSWTRQFLPWSSQTCDFLHFASATGKIPSTTRPAIKK